MIGDGLKRVGVIPSGDLAEFDELLGLMGKTTDMAFSPFRSVLDCTAVFVVCSQPENDGGDMVEQVGKRPCVADEITVRHLLADKAKLSALCLNCEHKSQIDAFSLTRYGKRALLIWLENKLRCAKCSTKGFCRLYVEWLE